MRRKHVIALYVLEFCLLEQSTCAKGGKPNLQGKILLVSFPFVKGVMGRFISFLC